jgi:hypothetical protein
MGARTSCDQISVTGRTDRQRGFTEPFVDTASGGHKLPARSGVKNKIRVNDGRSSLGKVLTNNVVAQLPIYWFWMRSLSSSESS